MKHSEQASEAGTTPGSSRTPMGSSMAAAPRCGSRRGSPVATMVCVVALESWDERDPGRSVVRFPNSWNESWGDRGYGRMRSARTRRCAQRSTSSKSASDLRARIGSSGSSTPFEERSCLDGLSCSRLRSSRPPPRGSFPHNAVARGRRSLRGRRLSSLLAPGVDRHLRASGPVVDPQQRRSVPVGDLQRAGRLGELVDRGAGDVLAGLRVGLPG